MLAISASVLPRFLSPFIRLAKSRFLIGGLPLSISPYSLSVIPYSFGSSNSTVLSSALNIFEPSNPTQLPPFCFSFFSCGTFTDGGAWFGNEGSKHPSGSNPFPVASKYASIATERLFLRLVIHPMTSLCYK